MKTMFSRFVSLLLIFVLIFSSTMVENAIAETDEIVNFHEVLDNKETSNNFTTTNDDNVQVSSYYSNEVLISKGTEIESLASNENNPQWTSDTSENEPVHIEELTEENDEYSRAFLNDDGTKTVYSYFSPIAYKDETGEYTLYDNTIVEDLDNPGYYTNKAGDIDVYLPDDVTQNPVVVQDGTYRVEMKPLASEKGERIGKSTRARKIRREPGELTGTPQLRNRKETVNTNETKALEFDIQSDIILEYSPINNGVKENIVLSSRPSLNEFYYELILSGLTPKVGEGGLINLQNAQQETVFQMGAPYMTDAQKEYSEDIELQIKPQGDNGKYVVTVIVDEAFLAKAVYPVVIDPVLTRPVMGTYWGCTVVRQATPNTNYSGSGLHVGSTDSDKNKQYWIFVKPAAQYYGITYGDTDHPITDLVRAEFIITTRSDNAAGRNAVKLVNITPCTTTLEDMTWTILTDAKVNTSKYPRNDYDYTPSAGGLAHLTWDITDMFKDWRTNYTSTADYRKPGFYLKANNTASPVHSFYTDNWSSTTLSEAYRPRIAVTYKAHMSANQLTTTPNKCMIKADWKNYRTSYNAAIVDQAYLCLGTSSPTNAKTPPKYKIAVTDNATTATCEFADTSGSFIEKPVYVWFEAYLVDGTTTFSNDPSDIAIVTIKDYLPPGTPGNFAASGIRSKQVTLSWGAVSDSGGAGMDSTAPYKVFYKTSAESTYSSVSSKSPSYVLSSLVPNTYFTAYIRAYDANGNYSQSSTIGFTTLDYAAPEVKITSISPSSWTNQDITVNYSITLDAENSSYLSSGDVKYEIDAVAQSTPALGTSTNSSFKLPASMTDGKHSITVTAKDNRNKTGKSEKVDCYKDTSPPTGTLTATASRIDSLKVKLSASGMTEPSSGSGLKTGSGLITGYQYSFTSASASDFVGIPSDGVVSMPNTSCTVVYIRAIDNANNSSPASTVKVQDTITLTRNSTAGGTVSGDGTFDSGTSRTVSTSVNSDYTFDGWYEGSTRVSTSLSYTFTLNGNRTLEARYSPSLPQYKITLTRNPTAGGTVSGDGTYTTATSCTVTATVNSGYTFDGWYEEGNRVSTSLSYAFTVNGARTLEARFTRQYTITLNRNPVDGGTVSGAGTYDSGTSRTITATVNSGYSFDGWYEGSTQVSTSLSHTFTLNGDRILEARFPKSVQKYTITLTRNLTMGGTVSGAGTYDGETSRTVTATVNYGYTFDGWYEGSTQVSTSLSYTFTLGGDRTLEAKFTTPQRYSPNTDGYSFTNQASSFGYSGGYKIPLSVWISVFGSAEGKHMYDIHGNWAGSCFGMSATSLLFNQKDLSPSSFSPGATNTYSIPARTSNVTTLIEQYQCAQELQIGSEPMYSMNPGDVDGLISAIDEYKTTGRDPVVLCFWGAGIAHAIVAYDYAEDSTKYTVSLYDNWEIGKTSYMYIPKSRPQGMRDITFSLHPGINTTLISYVKESTIKGAMLAKVSSQSMTLTVSNQDANIVNSAGIPISMLDGVFELQAPDMQYTSKAYIVPRDKYYVAPESGVGVMSLSSQESTLIGLSDSEKYISVELTGLTAEIGIELGNKPCVELESVTDEVRVNLTTTSDGFSDDHTKVTINKTGSYLVEFVPEGTEFSIVGSVPASISGVENEYGATEISVLLSPDTLIDTDNFTFAVGEITGLTGTTVTVPVSVINNPGFNAVAFIVSYDTSELMLEGFSATQSILPLNTIISPDTRETGSQVISMVNGVLNCVGDVKILDLKFSIRKNTEGDANITLKFTRVGEPSNIEGKDIDGAVTKGGKIAVQLTPPPIFNVGNVSAPRGRTVTVPISVEENPGINAVTFILSYDPSILEIIGFTAAQPSLPLNSTSILTTTPGIQTIGLINGLANYNEDGVILNVTFNIKANATPGNTNVNITFTTAPLGYPSNVAGYDFDQAMTHGGIVTVLNIVYGDLNRDGRLSNADLTLMLQYFAGWDVDIDLVAADVNADGRVTNADLTRMLQYFAGWDVTLGPQL